MKKLFTAFLLCLILPAFGGEVEVTFKVDMSQATIEYPHGVFLVGVPTDWAFVEMTHEGDEIYSVTLTLTTGEPMAYYYIVNDSWDDYMDYRETVPEECANSAEVMEDPEWNVDRAFVVPEEDVTYAYHWGSCETIGGGGTSVIGFRGEQAGFGFSAYPNPNNGIINVELSSVDLGGKIEVIDISGRIIRTFTFSRNQARITVDISDAPANVYFLRATDGNRVSVRKIIVK